MVVAELAKCSIFGKEPHIEEGTDWPSVLGAAADHGLTAVCKAALGRIPAGRGPDFQTALQWEVSSRNVLADFDRRHSAKTALARLFGEHGIRTLVLKGETLADNYPRPQERECGDIDIMLFDDFERGNDIVTGLGIALDRSNSKHTVFEFEGVEVENHDPVPHPGYNRNDYATELLVSARLGQAVSRADGCWELPPETAAVYIVNHTALHLHMNLRVSLKMLLDLALLLTRHPEVPGQWKSDLESTGLTRFAGVLLAASDLLFDTAFSSANDPRTARLARRFIRRYILCEGSRAARFFGQYAFVPRRPRELAAELVSKTKRYLKHRLK